MQNQIESLISVLNNVEKIDNEIHLAADMISEAFKNGNKLMLCGNGGSAAEAQHIAAEYVSSLRHEVKREALPAIALTTDTSFITANGNDYGFDGIFSRQIEALGKSGDILIAISTSGTSKNVVKAIETAKQKGIKVIGLTGESGGPMFNSVDILLKVQSKETMRIQETHLFIEHTICDLVEKNLFSAQLLTNVK